MSKKRNIASGLIVLFFCCLFLAANWKTSAQQQTEQTAEQRYKNIQVLKGMPESQVVPTMQFISSSLGVNCAHCHVNNKGDWEFEKDDKPAKKTARGMMQMVFDINRGNRDLLGGAMVTCYTCHRGSVEAVNIPKLPIPAPAAATASGNAAAAEALPTAAQLVDKYLQAIGGRAAADRLKTRVMKGSLIGSDGKEAPFEVRMQGPDKIVTIINGPQGTVTQALNGNKGWIKTAKEQRELRPNEVGRFRDVASGFEVVQVKEAAANMKVAGREKVGEREAYVVVWPVDERRTQKLYFDTETGLLLRVITYTKTLLARIPSQMDLEDYRDVEGVKLPFTVRRFSVDSRSDATRRFTEVKANVPLDDAQFNPPPAQK